MTKFVAFGSLENGAEFLAEDKRWRKIQGDLFHNAITVESRRLFEAFRFDARRLVQLPSQESNILYFPSRALIVSRHHAKGGEST